MRANHLKPLFHNTWFMRCSKTACTPGYAVITSKVLRAAGSRSKTQLISCLTRSSISTYSIGFTNFDAAGLPSFQYEVVLPGQIILSEVSLVPHGQINGNQVTLEVGEDFWREFGAIDHVFRVESLVSICESDCAEPHMIWDGVSEYPVCTCICEKGWEMRFEGCLDCETICREQDPDSVYDAAASSVNNCVCQVPSAQDSGGGAPVPGCGPGRTSRASRGSVRRSSATGP